MENELPGASLQVLDSNGTVVEEWISTDEPHLIRGLLVGETYTMVETKPADGYTTAESIEFKVEDTAEVQKHQMLDDVTKVEISKTDVTDSKEVPGAKLTILDKDGKVVESWVSKKRSAYGGEASSWEPIPFGKNRHRMDTWLQKRYLLRSKIPEKSRRWK